MLPSAHAVDVSASHNTIVESLTFWIRSRPLFSQPQSSFTALDHHDDLSWVLQHCKTWSYSPFPNNPLPLAGTLCGVAFYLDPEHALPPILTDLSLPA